MEQIRVKEIEQGKEKRNVPEIRFKGFDGEWEEKKLGNLCTLSSGSTPSKAKSKYFLGDNLWVTSGELKTKYIYNTIDKITDEAKKSSNLKTYDEETFIIAIYGLEAKGTRGSASILKEKATISQACMALETNSNLLSEYLYYWYEKNGDLVGIKYAQGTKQQNLSVDLVGSLILKVPSIREQKKIADFFSLVDKKIEKQSEKVEALKTYKKGMMQKIFSQEIRFKNENGEEFAEWEEKKIGDTLKIKHGKDQKSIEVIDGKYPILGTGGQIGRTNTPIYSEESVLIGRKGTIDKPVYMNTPFWTVDTLFYSQVYKPYVAKFIFYRFQYINWKKYCEASGVPSLSASVIENIKYKIPSLQEQTKIANFFSTIDKKIEKEEEKLEELKVWKKGLLQQMFV